MSPPDPVSDWFGGVGTLPPADPDLAKYESPPVSDIQRFIRPPTGQTAAFEPTREEIEAKATGPEETPLALRLLQPVLAPLGAAGAFIEKADFGQALKRFVAELPQGFGTAAEGFAKNSPFGFLSDALLGTKFSKEIHAGGIRRAWVNGGDQAGLADFAINFGIDLALDPIQLFLNPFGKVAAFAGRGAKVAASLGEAVELGQRAAIVLRVPLADLTLLETNLGFKSAAVAVGRGVDGLKTALRMSPLGDLLRKVSLKNPKMDTIEGAEIAIGAGKAGEDARQAIMDRLNGAVLYRIGRDNFDRASKLNEEIPQFFNAVAELGIHGLDDRAAVLGGLNKPDVMHALNNLDKRLASDETFAALYAKARGGDVDSIKKLYETERLPLNDDMLATAGLRPRAGIERSIYSGPAGVDATLPQEELVRRPFAQSEAEGLRSGAAAEARDAMYAARRSAHGELIGQADRFYGLPLEDRNAVNQYMLARAQVMQDAATMLAGEGLINTTFSSWAGPYVMRVASPETRAMFNSQVRGYLASMGDKGLSISASFLNHREATDLLEFEINAIAREIGTPSTGYLPLKDVAKAYSEHGEQGVLGKMFPLAFARAVHKVDPQAAELLFTNVMHNDAAYVSGVAGAIGKKVAVDAVIDSALVKEKTTLGNVADIQRLSNPALDYKLVVRSSDEPAVVRELSAEQATRAAVSQELRGERQVAAEYVKRDVARRLADGKTELRSVVDDLEAAKGVGKSTTNADLEFNDSDSWARAAMVGHERTLRDMAAAKAEALETARLHEMLTGKTVDIPAFDRTAERFIKSDEEIAKDGGLYERLDGLHAKYDAEAAGLKAKAEQALLSARNDAAVAAARLAEDARAAKFVGKTGVSEPPQMTVGAAAAREALKAKAAVTARRVKDAEKTLASASDFDSYLADKLGMRVEAAQTKITNVEIARRGTTDAIDAYAKALRQTAADVGGEVKRTAKDWLEGVASNVSKGLSGADMTAEASALWKMRERGISALDEAATIRLKDGSTLADRLLKSAPETEVYAMRRSDYEGVVQHLGEMSKPDPFRDNAIVRAFDNATSVWKGYTAANPFFPQTYVRNAITNFLSLLQHGFRNPEVIPTAVKARNALGRAIDDLTPVSHSLKDVFIDAARTPETEAMAARMQGGLNKAAVGESTVRLPVDELLQDAQRLGTVNMTASLHQDIMAKARDASALVGKTSLSDVAKDLPSAVFPWRAFAGKTPESGALMRVGYKVHAWSDDVSRFSGMLGAIKQGASSEAAADFANAAIYDSRRQLTAFERYTLRRAIPFYSWSKWAIGQTVDQFMRHPGTIGFFDKMRQNAYLTPPGGGEGMTDKEAHAFVPEFLRDGLGIPYRSGPEGTSFFLFGTYLPLGDAMQLGQAIKGMFDPKAKDSLLSYAASKMHPILKTAAEQIWNRDFFSGNDLQNFRGEHGDFMGVVGLPKSTIEVLRNFRFLSEIDRLHLIRPAEAQAIIDATGKAPIGQRADLPLGQRVAGSAFGFLPKTYLVDPNYEVPIADAKTAGELDDYRKTLRRNAVALQAGSPSSTDNLNRLRDLMATESAQSAVRDLYWAKSQINPLAVEAQDRAKRTQALAAAAARQRASQSAGDFFGGR